MEIIKKLEEEIQTLKRRLRILELDKMKKKRLKQLGLKDK